MARDIVDIAHVEVALASGSKELETIRSFSRTTSDPKTPVKTMNRRRRAIGYTRGVPDFSVDLEVAILLGTPDVDWMALLKSAEKFLITYERGDNGQRVQLVDCVVDEVSEPYDEGGETRLSIKVIALDERPE